MERDKGRKEGGGGGGEEEEEDGGQFAPFQQTDGSLTPTELSTGQDREIETGRKKD